VASITGSWWALGLRGLAAVVFGIACFAVPGIVLVVLIALFAAYLLVDGVFALIAGVRSRSWLIVFEGLLGFVAGGLAFFYPGLTAVAFAILIAAWAVVTGLIELGAAVALRRVIPHEWMLVAGGLLSILFGVMMALFPGAGLVAIVWLIGAYSLIWGALWLALAFRLHSYAGMMMPTA